MCAAAVFALALSGCGSSGTKSAAAPGSSTAASPAATGAAFPSQQLITQANTEGKVVVYAATAPADNDLFVKAFNKVYPNIKVVINRAAPTALNPRVEAEVRTKTTTADVYLTTDRQWLNNNTDLLSPIETPLASAANYKPWFASSGLYVGFQWHPGGLEWNTQELPKGVASFQALASLPASATIGILDPRLSTGALAWEYDATQRFGAAWLKSLLSHKIRFYPESTSLVAAVSSGEVEVGVPAFSSVAKGAQRSGAPVASSVGTPSIVSLLSAAIIKPGANPAAAQVLVDFLLTPAGQASMAQDKLSPLANVPGAIGTVKDGQTDIADVATISAADQSAFLKQFDSDAGRG